MVGERMREHRRRAASRSGLKSGTRKKPAQVVRDDVVEHHLAAAATPRAWRAPATLRSGVVS